MPEILFLSPLAVALLAVLAGMALLIRGGDAVVDSAAFLAAEMKIQPMIIGFTVIAFGTSLPELFVTVDANFSGAPGLAIGNVLGSNIANILLIIGVTAVVVPVTARRGEILRDMMAMLAVTALLIGLLLGEVIPRWAGWSMLALLVGYVLWQYRAARAGAISVEEPHPPAYRSRLTATLVVLAGLAAISVGARLLVAGASFTAATIGVPDSVIGMTVLAFGTSLPELSTCLAAVRKGRSAIVLGNITGSNVFNVLAILGITAGLKPLAVTEGVRPVDLWVLAVISLGFAALMLMRGQIGRRVGTLMIGCYVVFILGQYAGKLESGPEVLPGAGLTPDAPPASIETAPP